MPETSIGYLVGSANRRTILASLRDEGPLTRRDLVDRTSASRRTVKRTLDELQDRQWVERVEDGYEVTLLGATILDTLETAVDRIELANQFSPLLSRLSADAVGIDVDDLAGATLVSSTDGNPYAAVNRLHELRTDADCVRELRPALCLNFVEQVADRIVSEPAPPDVGAVVESSVPISDDLDADFVDALDTLTTADAAVVHICDEEVPLLLARYDDTAVICALNDDGIPIILVETTTPAVRDWVTAEYESYRQQSTPAEP